MKRITDEEIQVARDGVRDFSGKYPHSRAIADAQLAADLKRIRELVEKVKNPHGITVNLSEGVYEGLEHRAVERFRRSILSQLEESK